ncbi:hypothetical protein BAUCODRAFT_35950 [Baudoinia panamericana UAMH 10762]|uniref:Uncharacterized protein n=1 Tax=Baudoinia panamericana (strain UAMH 10762) TaxID=717646 RepID=M2N7D2_BAUPA|nr:uncharacterized protein BAUCODRAFT_35950 [Baudoinia panamericana UAMH 10762]EMC94710.1 hypothetical protein BAUCODRAFT_35950 [Baudoinia panamericana UAMH 10762]
MANQLLTLNQEDLDLGALFVSLSFPSRVDNLASLQLRPTKTLMPAVSDYASYCSRTNAAALRYDRSVLPHKRYNGRFAQARAIFHGCFGSTSW